MLAEPYRLKKRRDFSRIYNRGRSIAAPAFILYFMKRKGGGLRVGFSASKKIGNAVVRNRVKRVFRHAVANSIEQFPKGYDYIFILRNRAVGMNGAQASQEIGRAVARLTAASNHR